MMLALLVPYALASHCPAEPSLRDPDGEVTVLAQNLKFIITGTKRKERDRLLAEYLRDEGADVDLLLLSEARLTRSFKSWAPEWCFYTQVAAAGPDGYRWAPIESGRPPAGLAMGLRQRSEGTVRNVSAEAGRRYRARPTSFAEGFLGRLFGFRKGWAGLQIDDTHLVWSHTQASYKRRPERGAGKGRSGRAGQFADLAEDLGHPERATLITGDLNLLSGFVPRQERYAGRVRRAGAIDKATVARFRENTGIDLAWPWADAEAIPREERRLVSVQTAGMGSQDVVPLHAHADTLATEPVVLASVGPTSPVVDLAAVGPAGNNGFLGTYAGGFDRRAEANRWDLGAAYDRVGVNDAFLDRHPGTRVRRVDIGNDAMRVSDHLGLQIAIPFFGDDGPPRADHKPLLAGRKLAPRACRFTGTKRATMLSFTEMSRYGARTGLPSR